MKPNANPYREYQTNSVATADQKQLIIMLYDGAIRFIETASGFMGSFKTYDKANQNILRAQDILTELMLSLNLDHGGEIGQNLFNLYAFCKKQLLDANVKKNADDLKPALKILKELKESWEKIDMGAVKETRTGDYRGGFAAQG